MELVAVGSDRIVDRIVDYRPEFASQLVPMWRASFEHGVGIVDPHPIEQQHRYFLDEVVPHHRVRVVLDAAGAVVAFMASTPESVAQLYVRVADIGRGLGTRLLDVAKAESNGTLWLYAFARNASARRFYEKHGFSEVDRESANMYKIEAILYRWQRTSAVG
jgi:ribosomal protein S18 acetylase RimI-like enzyme